MPDSRLGRSVSRREKIDVANAAIQIREAAALLEKHGGIWARPLHDIARDLEAWIGQDATWDLAEYDRFNAMQRRALRAEAELERLR